MIQSFVDDHPAVFKKGKNRERKEEWLHGKASPLLRNSMESLIPYFSHEADTSSLILKHKFNEIILNLLNSDKDDIVFNSFLSIMTDSNTDLKMYMEKYFYLPYSAEEFAKRTFRSLSSFKKEFKEAYGTTPRRWINDKRLEKAKHLIETTDSSVTEISFLCGFESLSHFIMLFRKRYGVTPKQHRNGNR